MKTIFFIIAAGLSFSLSAQDAFDELIRKGISLHNKGAYQEAITEYTKALEIKPGSGVAHYEIAFAYFHLGVFKMAVEHSDKAIKSKEKNVLPLAYINKGSSLDLLGEQKKAIKVFKKAIKKFDPNHLFHFNLAVTYINFDKPEKGEKELANAIGVNPKHSSSHLLLGNIAADSRQKSKGMVSLFYFLMLEPNSERSKKAYRTLRSIMESGVSVDQDNPKKVTIHIDPNSGAEDLLLALMSMNIGEDKEDKDEDVEDVEITEEEAFINKSKKMISAMYSFSNEDKKKDWWRKFYLPFLHQLSKSEHFEAFCYHISQSNSQAARDWLNENPESVVLFIDWINENMP
ncbi:MAG: tetratricopeptide repeat protein [Cryomorphaceae bacterium]|nr:tetratricopeptide repeat protein [Cryomorphaceae bacterium]